MTSQPGLIRLVVTAEPTHATVTAVQALVDQATQVDRVAPISEAGILALARSSRGIQHLLAYHHDQLVGYAFLDIRNPQQPVAEMVVAPESRRQGIGSVLLRELQAQGGDGLSVWAHGNIVAAQRFAAKHDYVGNRILQQLSRSLTSSLPLPQFPVDIRIRPFLVGRDEPAWLGLNTAAFVKHPEQGRWSADDLTDREQQEWFDPAGFLLAESEKTGELIGSVWTKVDRAAAGEALPDGEIYVLAIHPEQQRRGLGAALTLAGMAYLQELGLSEVMLFVDESNGPAVQLYQRLGFVVRRTDVQYQRVPGSTEP